MSLVTNLSVLVPLRTEDFAFYKARLALRSALDLAGVETIVIDDGKINAFATHAELLKTNEIYREVYESQQKGEKLNLLR